MDDNKKEIRTLECQLAVREVAPDGEAQGESRTITGTAIVFNRESEILDDWGQKFREVILPEACDMSFLQTQDIKLNLLHEREMAIARCNKGQGSLRLSVDGTGVHFEFEAPRCDLGDRALELIRTGVYSGCSFEFYPKDYDVEEREDEVVIKHKRFKALTALTIGMDPAYRQTKVNAREMFDATPTGKAKIEAAKREKEQKEAEERERIAAEMKRRERVMAQLRLKGEDIIENSQY